MYTNINLESVHPHHVAFGSFEGQAITIVVNIPFALPSQFSLPINLTDSARTNGFQYPIDDPINIRQAYEKYRSSYKVSIGKLRDLCRNHLIPSKFTSGKWFISDKALGEWLIQNYHSSLSGGNHMLAVLFLAADPSDASRLRLGEEAREIQEKLQMAKLRDKFNFVLRTAVRPTDLTQSMLDINPEIVHFSGHGTISGALCFQDNNGQVLPISTEALSALFAQFKQSIRCVILNACYSAKQADVIAKYVDFVVGMDKSIGDDAAIAFSIGFYQALGAGRPFIDAYHFGVAQIQLQGIPEHLTPKLIASA